MLVNLQNKLGDTALHLAAYKGFPEIITALLERGADKTIVNSEGKLPYALATDAKAASLLQVRKGDKSSNSYLPDVDGDDSD